MKTISLIIIPALVAVLWFVSHERQHTAAHITRSTMFPVQEADVTIPVSAGLSTDPCPASHENAWQTVPENKNLLVFIP
ncbi:MAG TPA: hypothetical protein VJ203_16760 [Bacteroidales bacterium]|nr:hypothetical protein [Bacteroidales bacterium]